MATNDRLILRFSAAFGVFRTANNNTVVSNDVTGDIKRTDRIQAIADANHHNVDANTFEFRVM